MLLHSLLGLPTEVHQEDGTKDIVIRQFADMDVSGDGLGVSFAEFMRYMSSRNFIVSLNRRRSMCWDAQQAAKAKAHAQSQARPRSQSEPQTDQELFPMHQSTASGDLMNESLSKNPSDLGSSSLRKVWNSGRRREGNKS